MSIILKILAKIRILPSWLILFIDVILLIVSSSISYILFKELGIKFYKDFPIEIRFTIALIVYIFFFLVFKTYTGIIRYSTFIDALRLLLSTFSAFVILVTLNYLHFFTTGNKIYLMPALAIHFVIAFILLLAFRIAVKFLFENYLLAHEKNDLTKVVIYGSSSNSVALANALNLETPKRYQLVGFVDKTKSKLSKEVLGVPIIQKKKNVSVILRKLKADALILSDVTLSKDEKLKIVEDCLEYNFKILTLPTVSDWNDEKEISKSIKKFQIKDLLERSPIVLDNKKIAEQIKNKVILITGAAGSIGS